MGDKNEIEFANTGGELTPAPVIAQEDPEKISTIANWKMPPMQNPVDSSEKVHAEPLNAEQPSHDESEDLENKKMPAVGHEKNSHPDDEENLDQKMPAMDEQQQVIGEGHNEKEMTQPEGTQQQMHEQPQQMLFMPDEYQENMHPQFDDVGDVEEQFHDEAVSPSFILEEQTQLGIVQEEGMDEVPDSEEAGDAHDNNKETNQVDMGGTKGSNGNSLVDLEKQESDSKKTAIEIEGSDNQKKKKREINPDFQDVQKTGKWGNITKWERIAVAIVSLLIVVGVIATVAVVVTREDQVKEEYIEPPTAPPTVSATPIPATEKLSTLIESLKANEITSSFASVLPSDTPYYERKQSNGECVGGDPLECAISWLLFDDLFPADDDDDMVTRFALAAFYFSLGGNDWGKNENWLSPLSFCEWGGIKCNRRGSQVEEIDLNDNNLVGMLPLELSLLNSTAVISLKGNRITGNLPGDVIASLPKLFILYLQENNLTGPIPDNLDDNGALAVLFLHGNDFTGPFPANYCTDDGSVFQEFSLNCDANPCPTEFPTCCLSTNCY